MDILAAIDSFKGSASSFELNQAVLNGWEDRKGRKINVPIADGGENTAEAIYYALGGTWRTIDDQPRYRRCHFEGLGITGILEDTN